MIKTLEEYQQLASRTCPDLGSIQLNLSHMVMGMNSELSEVQDAFDPVNLAEELSDIMWYLANYANLKGYILERYDPTDTIYPKGLSYYIQELTDLVKKFVAYNKEISRKTELHNINAIIYSIDNIFQDVNVQSINITLLQSLSNNINKLRIRYPDKFNNESAINRNLEAERKELEK